MRRSTRYKAKDTIAELRRNGEASAWMSCGIYRAALQRAYCISGPNSPESGEFVEARHVESALSVMRPFFDCIVLDLPATFPMRPSPPWKNSNPRACCHAARPWKYKGRLPDDNSAELPADAGKQQLRIQQRLQKFPFHTGCTTRIKRYA